LISIKFSQSNSDRILLVSIYKSPEIKFSLQDWNDLFYSFNIGSFDTILIAGDLNAQYVA